MFGSKEIIAKIVITNKIDTSKPLKRTLSSPSLFITSLVFIKKLSVNEIWHKKLTIFDPTPNTVLYWLKCLLLKSIDQFEKLLSCSHFLNKNTHSFIKKVVKYWTNMAYINFWPYSEHCGILAGMPAAQKLWSIWKVVVLVAFSNNKMLAPPSFWQDGSS